MSAPFEIFSDMPTTDRSERIAIVGVGGIFPGAPDLDTFWNNIAHGVDSGRGVPPDRWFLNPETALDPEGPKPDRVYSTWGCFIEGFQFDPAGLNLDPDILRELDPLFHLGLHAARAAFHDARCLRGTELDRVGVILGNIVLPTESTSAITREVLGQTLFERLIDATPLPAVRRANLKADTKRDARHRVCSSLNRLAASLPAALIAEGLGLGGLAYTLDAACASSLYALKFACEELRAHRADAMLAGGMSRPDCQYTQMGFAQLKALSKRGRCAPLSAAADGLVVGEGAGVFILKRLSDALHAGDHIYGIIAGIGLSNDRGANLLAPHSEGQLRAMRSAYHEASWRPGDVDLIECHATGTPVGDGVEIDSLYQLWEEEEARPGQCVIGGVKSNVGHLLTGAGAAGLMKVLFAFKHQTLPPTANYVEPATALNRPDSPFRVLGQAEPWHRRDGGNSSDRSSPVPLRATINAFGFGGINAHVLIEEFVANDHSSNWPIHSGSGSLPTTAQPDSYDQGDVRRRRSESEPLDIAIVGLAVQTSRSSSLAKFLQDISSKTGNSAVPASHDWGVSQSDWYRRLCELTGTEKCLSFEPLSSVELPLGEFRIPPLEMQDMLPQQQLMLKVAAQALKNAATVHGPRDIPPTSTSLGNRTGVFVGIELDPNTANFHLRWSVEELAEKWSEILGLDLSPAERNRWTIQLKDSVGPPLSANRVMGNLGGIVASRLAREFNVGGPSFTISADENSGLRACELAAHALRRGELDQALVGSVDLPCDIRNQIAAQVEAANRSPGRQTSGSIVDGATAIVLKRLEDAVRDGDQIHAVIRRVNSERPFNDQTSSIDATPIAPIDQRFGAATGLLSLVAATGSLHEPILLSPSPAYWFQNQSEGPRRIQVPGRGFDGRNLTIELTEPKPEAGSVVRPLDSLRDRVELPAALFVVDGDSIDELVSGLQQLDRQIASATSLGQLARLWFRKRALRSDRRLAMTLIVTSIQELSDVIRIAQTWLQHGSPANDIDRRIYFTKEPLGSTGRLAFVFPGSGNAFLGMGRELLTAFPEILRRQDAENGRLKDQYRPDLIWYGDSTAALLDDHKAMIFGQVALGTAICDLLDRFGIRPTASVGYSLGESAALFGLRAWTDRDEMLDRMEAASLFGSDLVKPFNAARRAWRIPEGIDVPWVSGVIDRSASAIQAAISSISSTDEADDSYETHPFRVYLLIVNTPNQSVIGGDQRDVDRLVKNLSATFVPFSAPSTVHCEILREVEPAYRQLHLMRTTAPTVGIRSERSTSSPQPIDFYSTAWGRPYELSRESAAEAIVAQAVGTIDFPQVIERAYADGVRLFVEIGPGSSCTRMIDEILGERVHIARAAVPATANPIRAFLELLATLIAHRVPVDLNDLYGRDIESIATETNAGPRREVVTEVGGSPFSIPIPPGGWNLRPASVPTNETNPADHDDVVTPIVVVPQQPLPQPAQVEPKNRNPIVRGSLQPASNAVTLTHAASGTNVMTQLDDLLAARAKAHETYLRVSAEAQRIMADQLERLARLTSGAGTEQTGAATQSATDSNSVAAGPPDSTELPSSTSIPVNPPRSLSRSQCMEFAIGRIGRVLGEKFAAIDQYPTRVRLPDEPLMLVDRILEIDGEPRSMTSGRVVTEHDIHAGAWYLDCNRIPTCIAVEAGQADLFLSGWLGIDFETKGLACYRLLDAVVTFHRELPGPGKTIHYDIRINNFFRQGQTYLFRFEFDATVDGQPLLTMREGCAGFFTDAELAGGKGIVHTALDRQPRPGKRTADWRTLVPMTVARYDDAQLLALRQGNLEACFGEAFARLPLHHPVTIPGLTPSHAGQAHDWQQATAEQPDENSSRTRMWLVDRILKLDPLAGKFGLGMILGELDIHPNDWFITCHFCDDQVMPGTLMYECCMHTLRVFLLRMGWVGETGQVAYEPIPGIRSRLKCRGQVLAETKKVWYEITLKEIGYTESGTPYCLADALMYADGKPIVEITDMSVRLSGLTRSAIEQVWSDRTAATGGTAPSSPAQVSTPATHRPYDRRPALFDTDRITAFAIGNPSDAFGDKYRVFDSERTIARLPGPPFQFLDRIVSIAGCEPWILQPGGEVVAQYDIPPDAWYFASNRQQAMPFAVLLETALQPCGWLAAYVGSALTSETDISFRNLGGTATQFREVTAESGTLTTTVKMTRVSNSGGMIIQHYDFDLCCDGEPVYVGNTYFGFFSKSSLMNQIGIRDAKPFAPSAVEAAQVHRFPYIDSAPFADPHFQMIDDVQLSLAAGPFGHGFVIGTTSVKPESWFFKAHFYQDPVVPGSLGLESFFQLVKLYAAHRWQLGEETQFATPIIQPPGSPVSRKHEWVYRGQVVPRDQLVTVSAVIKSVNDATKEITAEGFLSVDGRIIYQMKEFSLGVVSTLHANA